MKKIFITILLPALLFSGCKKWNLREIPDDVIILSGYKPVADSLGTLLSESGRLLDRYPDLFASATQKHIIVQKDTYVYITFLDDLTSCTNSLCWYSYNESAPPQNADKLKYDVVFPNISKTGEGGKLEAGYTKLLSTDKFTKGTVISFFLLINGWNENQIDLTRPKYYTDSNLNYHNAQQHVLFKMSLLKYLVIGFEDGDYNDKANCDGDFNDVLFSVSDNSEGKEATSFNLTNIKIE